ncbi:MAG: hypothetical protein HY919_04170 [Elusimicrobia bacterium]|nr:hypothetical protein [Elusimicrobiota bacterium]
MKKEMMIRLYGDKMIRISISAYQHIIAVFSLTCLLAYSLTRCLYAAPSGNIQLSIASPDPATAGEKVTFQVIALNTGSEKWLSDEYYMEAEIYDAQKNYIKKTGKLKVKNDVNTGETALAYIPFTVPSSFSGEYFYKITLTLKEQRIIVSEYLPFTIVELARPLQPEKKVTVGGNAILSWKQSQKKYEVDSSSSDYNGSLNLNLVGNVYQTPVSLNVYALYTKSDQFDLDNFLFNYYGKKIQVAFGDIQPSYNSLTLYGAGIRGLNITGTTGKFSASIVGAQSAEKEEGTDTANGIYERYLYGGKINQGFTEMNTVLGGSYIESKDNENSIERPGTTLPVKNTVIGGDVYFEPIDFLGVKGDYGQSEYWEDISSGSVKDSGIRATISSVNVKNFSFTGIYSKIEPDFNSLGAPASTKDKESYELSTGYSLERSCSLSVYFNNYHDNLNKDPSKTTTTQNLGSVTLATGIPKYPVLTLGYSMNIAKGDPINALNNETKTPSVGISHTIKMTTLSLNAQQSKFKDKTSVSSDLKTDTGNLGFSTRIGENISVSGGTTLSKTLNIASSTETATGSYSLNINYLNIIKDKLSAAMWGSYTTSLDKPMQSTDNINTTGTVELTYNLRQNLSATLGYTLADYKDDISVVNSYKENSGNIRLSMSF